MCRHIRQVEGLGGGAEAQLFRQAQAGCAECLGVLMARHERLVYAVVRRQGGGALSMAEAVQAGRIGLWRAILRYNPARGVAFSTYAWPAIVRHIWQANEAPPAEQANAEKEDSRKEAGRPDSRQAVLVGQNDEDGSDGFHDSGQAPFSVEWQDGGPV